MWKEEGTRQLEQLLLLLLTSFVPLLLLTICVTALVFVDELIHSSCLLKMQAQQDPEPKFDLSECELKEVMSVILCLFMCVHVCACVCVCVCVCEREREGGCTLFSVVFHSNKNIAYCNYYFHKRRTIQIVLHLVQN